MEENKVTSQFPSEIVELPSKGYLYPEGSGLETGKIEIKYPTAREEDILTSQNLIRKGIVIDEFIKALIIDKKINIDNLLIGDKGAVMVAARKLAYGNEYSVKIVCESCNKEFQANIDLKEFKSTDIDEKHFTQGINEFTYTLPISKVEITGKLLTHSEQRKIKKELKQLTKLDGNDHEMTVRLNHIITSVNGDIKSITIRDFVNNKLLAKDSLKLRSYLSKITPNIETYASYTCSHCGHEMEGEVPLSTTFFWPSK